MSSAFARLALVLSFLLAAAAPGACATRAMPLGTFYAFTFTASVPVNADCARVAVRATFKLYRATSRRAKVYGCTESGLVYGDREQKAVFSATLRGKPIEIGAVLRGPLARSAGTSIMPRPQILHGGAPATPAH